MLNVRERLRVLSTYDSYILEGGLRPSDTKVVVAMSGGVDSSVAAAILARDGYTVAGVTLKLWCFAEDFGQARRCCSVESVSDAGAVCERLEVPHYVIDLRPEFRAEVVDPFCREYLDGRTPNPCVDCNTEIKFKVLLAKAHDMGADFICTGHHVRQIAAPQGGTYRLLKGVDAGKDQSYALWGLTQAALGHTVFPIGWHTKKVVRDMAREEGLVVADKQESQDVCFLPDGDITSLLDDLQPGVELAGPGEIRDLAGVVLGVHKGYYHFTLGQRRGLDLARGRRQYVVAIDPFRNVVYVGDDDNLMANVAYASDFNFIEGDRAAACCGDEDTGGGSDQCCQGDEDAACCGGLGSGAGHAHRRRVTAKIRYMHPAAPGWFDVIGDGRVRVTFDEPQRAITPGQSLVVYDGDRLLGGGLIERAER